MFGLAFVGAVCGGIAGLVPLRPLFDTLSWETIDAHYGKLRLAVYLYLSLCGGAGAWLFVRAAV